MSPLPPLPEFWNRLRIAFVTQKETGRASPRQDAVAEAIHCFRALAIIEGQFPKFPWGLSDEVRFPMNLGRARLHRLPKNCSCGDGALPRSIRRRNVSSRLPSGRARLQSCRQSPPNIRLLPLRAISQKAQLALEHLIRPSLGRTALRRHVSPMDRMGRRGVRVTLPTRREFLAALIRACILSVYTLLGDGAWPLRGFFGPETVRQFDCRSHFD